MDDDHAPERNSCKRRHGRTHLHDCLIGEPENPTAAIIDSQSERTDAEACEMVGFDRSKRLNGRKRHLVTDTPGLMLRIEVHPAGVRNAASAGHWFSNVSLGASHSSRAFLRNAGHRRARRRGGSPTAVRDRQGTETGFVGQPGDG